MWYLVKYDTEHMLANVKWLICDNCIIRQMRCRLHHFLTDKLLPIASSNVGKFQEKKKHDMHRNINWKWRVWHTKPPHDLFEKLNAEHNLDNRSWLTHGWQKKAGAVQETLPQGREKPVAGPRPVSRQRTETILPSEKEEGSVETQKQQSTF